MQISAFQAPRVISPTDKWLMNIQNEGRLGQFHRSTVTPLLISLVKREETLVKSIAGVNVDSKHSEINGVTLKAGWLRA